MKYEGNHNAVSEWQAEQASGWLLVNPRILVGLVGAVACFAWLFLMVGTSAVIPYVGLASPAVGSAHFLFVVGACVALFVTWAFSNELSSYRLVHYALAVACTLTGCVGLWILREQDAFLWAPALLSGCGFGFLYTLYGEYVCLFFYGSVKPYIHGIFACATIACAGLLFAGREMSFFFALLFPLVDVYKRQAPFPALFRPDPLRRRARRAGLRRISRFERRGVRALLRPRRGGRRLSEGASSGVCPDRPRSAGGLPGACLLYTSRCV